MFFKEVMCLGIGLLHTDPKATFAWDSGLAETQCSVPRSQQET